ncbi:hypothetical protein MFIFM68171_07370 [Madurella fahalii]|uniref:Uncharacterized protein n=1 Tax=Madurella fahalii TaxID=1157608 RepID=A0ABQ0GHX9_9PEZI
MTADMAQAFYDNASENDREWLANALFYRELESIRRDRPLLDPHDFATKELKLYDRDEASAAASSADVNLRGGARPRRSTPRSMILPTFQVRSRGFYRHPWLRPLFLAKPVTLDLLEDDDEPADPEPEPPGPLTAMRIDIPLLRMHIGYNQTFEDQFPKEIKAAQTDLLTAGYEYTDQETMFQSPDWLRYLHTYQGRAVYLLYKGFPMVEDVVFIMHPNYWTRLEDHGKLVHNGQCYWLSLALLLYGNASFWLRVKAEHLCFLERVLINTNHPRHAFYTRENQVTATTHATGPSQSANATWSGTVNLWERLQIPGCWTSDDMGHLTADVYGVFLVLYKYDSPTGDADWRDKIYDMKTYGAYNNQHIFLCFTHDNHFQPMVPNDYYSYEFKLPRPTLQATKKYRLVTRERRRLVRDGPGHHWRGQMQSIPPPLSYPSFEPEHLKRVAGYGPYEPKIMPPVDESYPPNIYDVRGQLPRARLHKPLQRSAALCLQQEHMTQPRKAHHNTR